MCATAHIEFYDGLTYKSPRLARGLGSVRFTCCKLSGRKGRTHAGSAAGAFPLVRLVFGMNSASLIVLVIRTRKPSFKSRPSKYLLMATLLVVVATLLLPLTALGTILGLPPLPLSFLLLIGVIVMAYIISAEIAKRIFYSKVKV